jgi:hypothetical protein
VWTAPFTSKKVKWKEVAATFRVELSLLAQAGLTSLDLDETIAEYTSERESRSFTFTADERED